MKSVAIVTPWYGPESSGGAESLARELARHLVTSGVRVTILTTCSRSFLARWEIDHFRPGKTMDGGVIVQRFALSPRNSEKFDDVNRALLNMDQSDWSNLCFRDDATSPFIDESINSADLERHLRQHGHDYDAVLFIPYLYGVVVRGIEALGGRAHLIPCLHDEAYAQIPRIVSSIHKATTLLFNSDGEAELALRLYGPGILHKSYVIGSGLEEAVAPTSEPIPYVGDDPFVLYLGRRDVTKNVDFLVNAYSEFRRLEPASDLRLVLAGPGVRSYFQPGNGVIDLGFVDASLKRKLLQRATALAQPSTNESYSRVLMEAWRERRPVIVHGDCLATAVAVRESRGGLIATSTKEWVSALRQVAMPENGEIEVMASGGELYARGNSEWSAVIARLRDAVGLSDAPCDRGKQVDQVVQTFEYGDAISDYAMHVRNHLRRLGYQSTIWAEGIGLRVATNATYFDRRRVEAADAILYHHSIGTSITDSVVSLRAPKALIYHNVTPAAFFSKYRPAFAELLEAGRAALVQLAGKFDKYVGDSDFNAAELTAYGVPGVQTIPVLIDYSRFDVTPDVDVLRDNAPGMRWLFVGRVAPNKGLRQLIEALDAFRRCDRDARLFIVGRFDPDDPYYDDLRGLVVERGLDRHVIFAGVVTDEVLAAHYRRADVFVTLSEHEGFCVPVVEAMFFDLPVVALAETALPETLGSAGLLVEREADAADVAALIFLLRTDHELATKVLEAQRTRRADFAPNRVYPKIQELVADLLA